APISRLISESSSRRILSRPSIGCFLLQRGECEANRGFELRGFLGQVGVEGTELPLRGAERPERVLVGAPSAVRPPQLLLAAAQQVVGQRAFGLQVYHAGERPL